MPETVTGESELERLRDILYGAQFRAVEKRLAELEGRTETVRRELTDLVNEKVGALADSSSAQLASIRRELTERLERQAADQSAQLRTAQQTLSERIDHQSADHAAQLRAVQKELSDRIEKLAADLLTQLRSIQKETNDRVDQLKAELSERIRSIQAETRQRDDSLRQELLALAASLDDGKISRYELGQMLMEISHRLQGETRPAAPSRQK